jgi:hypothetical protein
LVFQPTEIWPVEAIREHDHIRARIMSAEGDLWRPRVAYGRAHRLGPMSGGMIMAVTTALIGSSPGTTVAAKLKIALLRGVRTLLQGIASAFPSAGAGTIVLSTGYWQTFGYACLAALITAFVSFLHNAATIFPEDPTQSSEPAPQPAPLNPPPEPAS